MQRELWILERVVMDLAVSNHFEGAIYQYKDKTYGNHRDAYGETF